MLALLRSTITQPRNMVIVMAHWCLHAYGIISLTQLTDPLLHSLVLLLVPLPALFYILTARYCITLCVGLLLVGFDRFTDPNKFYL